MSCQFQFIIDMIKPWVSGQMRCHLALSSSKAILRNLSRLKLNDNFNSAGDNQGRPEDSRAPIQLLPYGPDIWMLTSFRGLWIFQGPLNLSGALESFRGLLILQRNLSGLLNYGGALESDSGPESDRGPKSEEESPIWEVLLNLRGALESEKGCFNKKGP